MDDPESTQIDRDEPRAYRINRKLSPADLKELYTLYEAGVSMLQLAQKFECTSPYDRSAP